MKNNRLTNDELMQLKESAKEIRRLVSMKGCSFRDEKTIDIKMLKIWLQWFGVEAYKIESIVNL